MIVSFKEFEAKLYNLAKITGVKDIIKITDDNFYNDDLIKEVYLYNCNKTIKIVWNDKKSHNIKDKIRNRSQFISIKHFNETFIEVVNELFSKHFHDIKYDIDIYDLYLTDSKLHIITKINYNNLLKNKTVLYVITVLPNTPKDVGKIIEFNF